MRRLQKDRNKLIVTLICALDIERLMDVRQGTPE